MKHRHACSNHICTAARVQFFTSHSLLPLLLLLLLLLLPCCCVGMKNATKGAGSLLGAVLVGSIGFIYSLLFLIIVCAVFIPLAVLYMDHDLGRQVRCRALAFSCSE